MDPICFHIAGRPIYWYGVSVAVGFLLSVLLWSWLARKRGYPDGIASELGFWLIVSGLLGARLAYILANAGFYFSNPLEIFRFDKGGLIYYGGFIGGTVGLWLFARRRGKHFFELMDFAIPGLALGHASGRLGCLMNGCCFGKPWDGPFAVSYPAGSEVCIHQADTGLLPYAGMASLPVHPVQVYESLANIALAAFLAWLVVRKAPAGRGSAWYLLIYPVIRFVDEFLRGDGRQMVGPFTTAQFISILLFLYGIAVMAWSLKRSPRAHDTA